MSMRKTAKRLFAALAALVMAFAVVTPAFAAEGTGTITITNATVGESYAGYKVFDVTYTEENSDVSYRIYEDNQFFNAINGEGSPFTLTESAVDGVYNVAVNEGVTDEQIITWLSSLVGEGSSYTADLAPTQATSATVSWTKVPYGYYLITSSLGSVVTIDKNNPNAEIVDKNQQPGTDFEKAVDGTDEVMQIGVPFTFTLSFGATNYDGENAIEKYTVSDTFPEGMDLVEGENNVTIKINDGTEYTLYETVTLDENNSFSFDIDWSTVSETGEHTFTYASPATVTVTYQAVLNADAEIEGAGETNAATLTWTGNPEGSESTTSETVYTYALAIKKVDSKGSALPGAEFKLADTDGNEVKVSAVDGQDGVYVVDPNGSAVITSPASGVVVIKGVDSTQYSLTETKAPGGYNLLTEAVDVTPVRTGATTTNTTIYLDAQGNVVDQQVEGGSTVTIIADIPATAVAVVNFAGSTLPSTGGMGTTTLYIVGGALVAATGIALVVRRRMNNEA